MKPVQKETLLPRLEENRSLYCAELEALQIYEKDCTFYANEAEQCFAIVQQYPASPETPSLTFCGFEDGFLQEVLASVKGLRGTVSVSVLTLSDETQISISKTKLTRKLKGRGKLQLFGRTEPPGTVCEKNPHIRALQKPDRMFTEEFPDHKNPNTLPLQAAFQLFVEESGGEIFAYFDTEDQMAGYVSCRPMYENVWDVVYIYVRPEKRGQGIGTQLAVAYLQELLAKGRIPIYSGVSNPASAKAAINAGFMLCGWRHCYELALK